VTAPLRATVSQAGRQPHIDATTLALVQLPRRLRRRVLIRADSSGGTHDYLKWLARPGRRLAYSVGFTITDDLQDAILNIPPDGWTPAYDAGRQARPGAWVAEITGILGLSTWPRGMRLIVRKERPHPGAQLRFTDLDGHRITCFATSTKGGQLADLELHHRRRARCEDRIRCAKGTGLRNLPLHGYDQNKIWCEVVALPCDLLAWTQMLALTGRARRREPRKLRLRVFSAAGRIVRGGCGSGSASRPGGPGQTRSSPASPGSRPSRPADQAPDVSSTRKGHPAGPWNPARSARQPGSQADRRPEKAPGRSLRPPIRDHETSRLGRRFSIH
jgi:Transposase DDE domain group 1